MQVTHLMHHHLPTHLIKVSQTIADLAKEPVIAKDHVAEAISYRNKMHQP